jgi:hypothetical protein
MLNNKNILLVLVISLLIGIRTLMANVYVVIYVTQDGATGHAGIAVDNYELRVSEKLINGAIFRQVDTVANGTLTFFDLWPQTDIPYGRFNKDTEPRYNRFPRSSAERPITVESLLEKGLPRGCRYPCDALLRIQSTPQEDFSLLKYLDTLPSERPFYNARKYNCVDFVRLSLAHLCGMKIRAKEFVPLSMISTPNRFFRALKKEKNRPVEILRDPGPAVKRSFLRERVFKFNVKT